MKDSLILIDKPKQIATPFVKWAGGKRAIINELKCHLPTSFKNYYEPFLGGGALFFDLQPKNSHISDVNLDLIITYKVIQNQVMQLLPALKKHQNNHSKDYYYSMRSQHNCSDPVEVAARMIYLNKTCFNGLFRVNRKGEFNTPLDNSKTGRLITGILREDNLLACSKALEGKAIEFQDYSRIKPEAGDFVYFDPPYHPTNGELFTRYSSAKFLEKDQYALADFCKKLHNLGVYVMLSNSNTEFVRNLYQDRFFTIDTVIAPRNVNCKISGRTAVEEVIITNY